MNNSITIVKERGVKVDVYRLYETSKLKLVIIIIAPSITFIFKRIYIGLVISIVLLDIQVYTLSTIVLFAGVVFPEFKEYTIPTFLVRVSALLKPTPQSSLPRREASITLLIFYFLLVKPTTTLSSSISLLGKYGVTYNNILLVLVFQKYLEITWAYNQANIILNILLSIKYVPILQGLRDPI